MMKLNEVITDLEGSPLTRFEYINGTSVEIPIKYSELLYSIGVKRIPKSDEEASNLYNLLKKLYSIIESKETESNLSSSEIELCKNLLTNQKVIVRAKFLEMTGN